MHHNSILYKEPTICNFGSIVYWSLQDYSTYFGRYLRPSSRPLKTVVAAIGRGDMYPVRRLPHCGNRPRNSLLDTYHPDQWHAPVAATTAFSAPDDGRR